MKYIASCSFGKDSIATILLAIENNEPLDGAVFSEVMFDLARNISGENPEHIEWIYTVAIPKLAALGCPVEVDMMQPDYDIYPLLPKDVAYGFLTRGCPNKCKWCVVPRKEGAIRPYMDIDQIATPQRRKVILMDNNILAAGDYAKEQLQKIIDRGYRVDFNQALDARLVTDEFAAQLAQISWLERRIRFGCDTPAQVKECERAMWLINSHGYKGEFFLYTMLNDNFEECYERINHWWKKNQELVAQHHKSRVYPYAQPYRDPYNPARPIPQWQKDLAGWVNKKMLFEKISFEEFEPRKGFRCREYLRQRP